MPAHRSAMSRGTDRGRSLVHELGRQAESARLERGTSYAAIGRAIRMSGPQVARICRGQSPALSVVRAAQVMAALGLELSLRAFPDGAPIRDAAQLALLSRLRRRMPEAAAPWWRVEVPVVEQPIVGAIDRRAWDAAIDGPGICVRIEAETHVGDVQAVQRRIALKQRDGRAACVILLLAETRHHRLLLREAGDGLRGQFPVSAREALRALARGQAPPGNAIVSL